MAPPPLGKVLIVLISVDKSVEACIYLPGVTQ